VIANSKGLLISPDLKSMFQNLNFVMNYVRTTKYNPEKSQINYLQSVRFVEGSVMVLFGVRIKDVTINCGLNALNFTKQHA